MSNKRVVWTNPDGSVSVLVPGDESVWLKDVPKDVEAVFTTVDKIPQDRTFRAAWKQEGDKCVECPVKSKEVAHEIRRAKRAEEFKPLDEIIAIKLPGKDLTEVEAQRQAVRDKYAALQVQIDEAQTVEQLKQLIK